MDGDTLLAQAASGRRQLKATAAAVEARPELRPRILAAARRRGVELPDEAIGWPAKRLLRRALGRGDDAQVRSNPIRVDEAFACLHCGESVDAGGARVRDHCPRCLRSRHVDVVPGDRASSCLGILDPVGLEQLGESWVIAYRCRRCRAAHRCRAHEDDDVVELARTLAG